MLLWIALPEPIRAELLDEVDDSLATSSTAWSSARRRTLQSQAPTVGPADHVRRLRVVIGLVLLAACHSSSGQSRVATLGRSGTTTRQTRTSGPVQPALSGTVGSELWTVASAPGADGKVCQTVVVRPAQPSATVNPGQTEPNSRPTCAGPPGPKTDPVEGLQYRELPDASLVGRCGGRRMPSCLYSVLERFARSV